MQDTGQPETIAAPGETGVVIKPEKTDISKNLTIFALYKQKLLGSGALLLTNWTGNEQVS